MKSGIIYALYYNNMPFYIGQTTKLLKTRFSQHKCFSFSEQAYNYNNTKRYLYNYIRSITTYESFYTDITIRLLKVVNIYELDSEEVRYIKHCINNKINLYNSCVKTNLYCVLKYKKTIEEYNSCVLTNTYLE